MPFNARKTATLTEKELLRYAPQLNPPIPSVVLDATDVASWPAPTDGSRFQVPVGTILKKSATNSDQMVKYNGSGTIEGVLGKSVDLLANATNSDEPAPMYYAWVVFATESIVDFTLYASALVNDLGDAQFR